MGRIQHIWQEIKAFLDHFLASWGLVALIFVSVLGAFGLGRLSALIEAKPLVQVAQAASEAAPRPLQAGGYYVASRNGSVYYFPWCAGAGNIAEANKRWFTSEEAAKAAGYRAAKNCKGLLSQ
jgi:hypothetical protein